MADILQNITGATWPSSGTANAASVGVDYLNGAATHVGSTDLPAWSASNGYIESSSTAGIDLRIDSTSVPFVTYDDHWVSWSVRFVPLGDQVLGTALGNPNTSFRIFDLTWQNSVPTTVCRVLCDIVRVNDATYLSYGCYANISVNTGGGTSDELQHGTRAYIPFNTWIEFGLHFNISSGVFEVFMNGILIAWAYGVTTTDVTQSSAANIIFKSGGISNLIAQITGPIRSYEGTNSPFEVRWSLNDGRITKRFIPVYPPADSAPWTVINANVYNYSNGSGTNPFRRVFQSSGTGSAKSKLGLGNLSFDSEGYETVGFLAFLVPSGLGLIVSIRDASDSNTVVKAEFKTTADFYVNDIDTGINFDPAKRYALFFSFGSSGTIGWTLLDITTFYNGSNRGAWSGVAGTWTVQELGPVFYEWTNSTVECDGVVVGVSLNGSDSLNSTDYTPNHGSVSTVKINVANRITQRFPFQDCYCVPGCSWPLQSSGYPFGLAVFFIGRSGLQQYEMFQNALQYCTDLRGVTLVLADSSINDAVGGSVANWSASLDNIFSWINTHSARLIYSAPMVRPYSASVSAGLVTTMRKVLEMQTYAENLFLANIGNSRFVFSDCRLNMGSSDTIFVGGDGTHPVDDSLAARTFALGLTSQLVNRSLLTGGARSNSGIVGG